jgi:hypothetical protein
LKTNESLGKLKLGSEALRRNQVAERVVIAASSNDAISKE